MVRNCNASKSDRIGTGMANLLVRHVESNLHRFRNPLPSHTLRELVLELTYTSHDIAAFARDMGYLNAKRKVKPPFRWDEDRRRMLRAKLDAVYFHLYGVTDRDDVRYVYSTFSIIEGEEIATHGRYLSRDLCLGKKHRGLSAKPSISYESLSAFQPLPV